MHVQRVTRDGRDEEPESLGSVGAGGSGGGCCCSDQEPRRCFGVVPDSELFCLSLKIFRFAVRLLYYLCLFV